MKKIITFFSLFGSLGTLLCCALPVALVSVGMGASFVALNSAVPQLQIITANKEIVFILTAALLVLSYFLIKKGEQMACPVDPAQREVCSSVKPYTKYIFWFSVVCYLLGVLFSYLLPWILDV